MTGTTPREVLLRREWCGTLELFYADHFRRDSLRKAEKAAENRRAHARSAMSMIAFFNVTHGFSRWTILVDRVAALAWRKRGKKRRKKKKKKDQRLSTFSIFF